MLLKKQYGRCLCRYYRYYLVDVKVVDSAKKSCYGAQVAKKELKLECDYVYEARCQTKFVELIEEDADFQAIMHVPKVIPELCSHSVLTSEWVPGVHIDKVSFLIGQSFMRNPFGDAVKGDGVEMLLLAFARLPHCPWWSSLLGIQVSFCKAYLLST